MESAIALRRINSFEMIKYLSFSSSCNLLVDSTTKLINVLKNKSILCYLLSRSKNGSRILEC